MFYCWALLFKYLLFRTSAFISIKLCLILFDKKAVSFASEMMQSRGMKTLLIAHMYQLISIYKAGDSVAFLETLFIMSLQ